MSESKFTTDVDGNDVHPSVTEMARTVESNKHVHEVQINYWEDGRIQLWTKRRGVPSDVFELIRHSMWETRYAETKRLDGGERGYIEIVPAEIDPSVF